MDAEAFYVGLGKTVREVRLQRDWKQEQLAEAAGLSTAQVSHIETARRHPSTQSLLALAEALDLSLPELVAGAAQASGLPEGTGLAGVAAGGAAHGAVAGGLVGGFGRAVGSTPSSRWLKRRSSSPEQEQRRQRQDESLSLDVCRQVLNDPVQTADLAQDAMEKVEANSASFPEHLRDAAATMASLVVHYADGTYRACPLEHAVLLVAALQYLVRDVGVLPDVLPQLGLFDDVGVVKFVSELAAHDLDAFEVWAMAATDAE